MSMNDEIIEGLQESLNKFEATLTSRVDALTTENARLRELLKSLRTILLGLRGPAPRDKATIEGIIINQHNRRIDLYVARIDYALDRKQQEGSDV